MKKLSLIIILAIFFLAALSIFLSKFQKCYTEDFITLESEDGSVMFLVVKENVLYYFGINEVDAYSPESFLSYLKNSGWKLSNLDYSFKCDKKMNKVSGYIDPIAFRTILLLEFQK